MATCNYKTDTYTIAADLRYSPSSGRRLLEVTVRGGQGREGIFRFSPDGSLDGYFDGTAYYQGTDSAFEQAYRQLSDCGFLSQKFPDQDIRATVHAVRQRGIEKGFQPKDHPRLPSLDAFVSLRSLNGGNRVNHPPSLRAETPGQRQEAIRQLLNGTYFNH